MELQPLQLRKKVLGLAAAQAEVLTDLTQLKISVCIEDSLSIKQTYSPT